MLSRRYEKAQLKDFAQKITLKNFKNHPICLIGDLGAGKTTLVKMFLKVLGYKKTVNSPTFNIVKVYNFSKGKKHLDKIYHLDCYRLNHEQELLALGFQEWLADPKALVIIEWADKIQKILPKPRFEIKIKHYDLQTRLINLELIKS
ncbi:MAG: tRNA (adenosine(37)-N6)-threonylcarbamoyltransferase complex ATPase subunit type 1 TsaE [Candidatus Moranbacteria bacterium]|nr:tRNA (adenosine(37)-N6)-threonylcarbamoyltransferase complex ATPase subunit type 1 TsaE [Candidatus Moranbacteria bacterium]